MSRVKLLPVDEGRLREVLKERGLSLAQVSIDMGYARTALAKKLKEGKITQPDSKLLETIYNIKYDDYKPLTVAETTGHVGAGMSQAQLEWSIEKVLQKYQPIDYERLYKVVYSAMVEALKADLRGDENVDEDRQP